jgi:hypothetical protein
VCQECDCSVEGACRLCLSDCSMARLPAAGCGPQLTQLPPGFVRMMKEKTGDRQYVAFAIQCPRCLNPPKDCDRRALIDRFMEGHRDCCPEWRDVHGTLLRSI